MDRTHQTATRLQEVEVKIRLPQAAPIAGRLRKAGFRLASNELERDVVFDTPGHELRGRGCLLRLRHHGVSWLLTYKGPARPDSRYKDREEIETEIADGKRLELLLERLGYRPAFVYEKRRRIFLKKGEPGLAALDHTPIGEFLELEGPRRWIDRAASRLGFGPTDYVTASYAVLYWEYCREHGISPSNMVFAKARTK